MRENEKLERKLNELIPKVKEAFVKGGHNIARIAKGLVPVDTGRLRASIFVKESDNRLEIGTNVHYAPFVEIGHNPVILPVRAKALRFRIRGVGWIFAKRVVQGEKGKSSQWEKVDGKIAKPFLRPAVNEGVPKLIEDIRRTVREVLNR